MIFFTNLNIILYLQKYFNVLKPFSTLWLINICLLNRTIRYQYTIKQLENNGSGKNDNRCGVMSLIHQLHVRTKERHNTVYKYYTIHNTIAVYFFAFKTIYVGDKNSNERVIYCYRSDSFWTAAAMNKKKKIPVLVAARACVPTLNLKGRERSLKTCGEKIAAPVYFERHYNMILRNLQNINTLTTAHLTYCARIIIIYCDVLNRLSGVLAYIIIRPPELYLLFSRL